MVDEKVSNEGSLPPKVDLKNTDALKAGSGATLSAKPITLKAKPVSKSETAKIPLASGITIVDDAPHTKTIKIKPVSLSESIRIDVAPGVKASIPTSPAVKIAKSQTSKIPLDAVLSADSPVNNSGPKTIRLKRPSATSTPTAVPTPAPAVAKIAKDVKSDISKTSRLDIEDAGIDSSATPTRRKTIRVKRPSAGGAAPSLNIARSEPVSSSGGALPTAGAPLPPVPLEEEVEEKCAVSGIASIAALFIVCTLIYVLLAQATGKDRSLSQLSCFMPELNLSWSGRIPTN